jgi:hypothetical protein
LTFVTDDNPSATGETLYTDAGISYNPSTNNLATTTFTGALVGNADTATSATSAGTVELTATNTGVGPYYPTFVDTATGNENVRTDTGYTYNATTGTLTATVFAGKATSAEYADVAEIYSSDALYEPGTVVKLGGEAEITQTTTANDNAVFGVISTDPAYLMNSKATGLPVALVGRVPCKVTGLVKKGDRIVSSDQDGIAKAEAEFPAAATRAVIGRALQDKTEEGLALIEVVIGVK